MRDPLEQAAAVIGRRSERGASRLGGAVLLLGASLLVGLGCGNAQDTEDDGGGDGGARDGSSLVGTACTRAGGFCLGSGASCGAGFVSDPGVLSCEPAVGDGPNRPCCLPQGTVGDGGGGHYGPCSLAEAGHPQATAVAMEGANLPAGPEAYGYCPATFVLLTSAAEYDAYLRTRNDGGAPDAGAAPVDWTTKSLLVIGATSQNAFTFGREGDVLVVSVGSYCQGAVSACTVTGYAVPKVTRVEQASCPAPQEPCLAP